MYVYFELENMITRIQTYEEQKRGELTVYCSINPAANSLGINNAVLRSSKVNVIPIPVGINHISITNYKYNGPQMKPGVNNTSRHKKVNTPQFAHIK